MRRRFEEVVQGFGENFLFRTRISPSLSRSGRRDYGGLIGSNDVWNFLLTVREGSWNESLKLV